MLPNASNTADAEPIPLPALPLSIVRMINAQGPHADPYMEHVIVISILFAYKFPVQLKWPPHLLLSRQTNNNCRLGSKFINISR